MVVDKSYLMKILSQGILEHLHLERFTVSDWQIGELQISELNINFISYQCY